MPPTRRRQGGRHLGKDRDGLKMSYIRLRQARQDQALLTSKYVLARYDSISDRVFSASQTAAHFERQVLRGLNSEIDDGEC